MEETGLSGSICSPVSPGIQAGLVLLDCQLQKSLSFSKDTFVKYVNLHMLPKGPPRPPPPGLL